MHTCTLYTLLVDFLVDYRGNTCLRRFLPKVSIYHGTWLRCMSIKGLDELFGYFNQVDFDNHCLPLSVSMLISWLL